MARFGVVIEAQEGLTWEGWRRMVHDTERLGFASLRVSDHLQSIRQARSRAGLPAWSALHLAAEWSERLELATMVSPVTFYQPGVLLREAFAIDRLSEGRLLFGVGAGWNQAEHERFEVPFGDWTYRFDRLEQTIRLMQRLGREIPDARPLPLLLGGNGPRRTLPLVARYAREWNGGFHLNAAAYREIVAALDAACAAIGREPRSLRHSLQTVLLIGRTEAELRERAAQMSDMLGFVLRLESREPDDLIAAARDRFPAVGTPAEIVERLRPFVDAGVELFIFEHFLQQDAAALELLATEVMPRLA